jgi:hypothetical protein
MKQSSLKHPLSLHAAWLFTGWLGSSQSSSAPVGSQTGSVLRFMFPSSVSKKIGLLFLSTVAVLATLASPHITTSRIVGY